MKLRSDGLLVKLTAYGYFIHCERDLFDFFKLARRDFKLLGCLDDLRHIIGAEQKSQDLQIHVGQGLLRR